MNELLKLILTGERFQRLKAFENTCVIAAVAELLLGLPLLFMPSPEIHFAVSVTLGLLVTAASITVAVLNFRRPRLYRMLVNEQIISPDGEEARRSLAEKFIGLYKNRSGAIEALPGIIPLALFVAASVINVLVNLGISTASVAAPVLCLMAGLSTVAVSVIPESKNCRLRTELYESADAEITLLKKAAGVAEGDIVKQAYAARKRATRSQELFLHDPADRAELRKITTGAGYFATVLVTSTAILFAVLSSTVDTFGDVYVAVGFGCIIAFDFVVFLIATVRLEILRRAIYRRNEAKLTDSEPDLIRKNLQDEFMKLQRRGNIFFLLFCGIFTVAGFILGAASAFADPEISFIENVAGTTVIFFVASAAVALIIWAVIYARYRKKVKPAELQLSGMTENYGRKEER